MQTLKIVCLLFCAMGVASAVSGISAISFASDHTEIGRHDLTGRIVALGLAGVFALAWYGIHRRFLATWWFGWLVLFSTLGDFLYAGLAFAFGLPEGQRWALLGGIVLIVLLVFGYWASWWKRQRGYFDATPSI